MTKFAKQIGDTSERIQVALNDGNKKLSDVGLKVRNAISESTRLIQSSNESINSIIKEVYSFSDEISAISKCVDGYKKSTSELDEIVNQITKTSNTLGTAAADTKLVKVNLEELIHCNDTSTAQIAMEHK
jgi:methyl-accepting chemotaxis protein